MSRFVLLLVVTVLVAAGDTLDFARYTIEINYPGDLVVGSEEAALLKARALAVLGDAVYDRDITVADFLAANPKNGNRLDRMTMNSRKSATKFLSDGATTVDYEFPIPGALMEQLLPVTGDGRLLGRVACPCCGQGWPAGEDVPPGVQLAPLEDGNAPQYTGILVDARGLGLRPALFPRVVNGADDEVYGPGFVDPEELARKGMVGYFRDQPEALVSERLGPGPLVVRALGVTGLNQCDVVVSDHDAARIHGTKTNLALLAGCRVGVLAD